MLWYMCLQVWHSHMQPLADAMMALQTQKLAVGMQLQVRAPEVPAEVPFVYGVLIICLAVSFVDGRKLDCVHEDAQAQQERGVHRWQVRCAQESWWRQLQVLPARTHPTMSTSGTGGYLLSGTKVVAPGAALAPNAVVAPGTVVRTGAAIAPGAAGVPGAVGGSALGGKRQRTS